MDLMSRPARYNPTPVSEADFDGFVPGYKINLVVDSEPSGHCHAQRRPDHALPMHHTAGTDHWAPGEHSKLHLEGSKKV